MNCEEEPANQGTNLGESSGFVRQGSLRRVIPGENNNENLFMKNKGELSKLYKNIRLEYVILAEYKTVISENIQGVYVIPSRDNFLAWFGVIFVKSGPYEEGVFRFDIILEPDFPDTPKLPTVCFQSKMFHPVVHQETNELSLLKAFTKWDKSENHIWQVLKYIKWIFHNVEGSLPHAVNEEAVSLFKNDKEEFQKKARNIVEESLEHLYDEPPTDDKHYIRFEMYDPNIHEPTRAQLLTQKHEELPKYRKSWVLPGSIIPLGRPPTPDSEKES
ncbi:protein crossbronx homolog [Coccinella septempunctata]|uniref:protein crossbronx homolog n=1 Tax=Coccinella septempunctata TaxID=41139 RepID=UPI001D08EE6F|nr:protein crossbronx homolog [Coccinella septempunctata]